MDLAIKFMINSKTWKSALDYKYTGKDQKCQGYKGSINLKVTKYKLSHKVQGLSDIL